MLHIYSFILETTSVLTPLASQIARGDSDLARQMRRAMMSVPLNVAEGFYSQGRNRKARYHTALGSAREVLACVEVAQAMGIITALDADAWNRLDSIIRTLSKLSR
jgi:four helix bundle protein